MNPEQNAQAQQIVRAVRSLPGHQRASFLDLQCGDDNELRMEVDSRLSAGGDRESIADPSLPSQIGSYRIERELGRGAMGVVYLARDMELDRAVAIKVLPEELVRDESRLARFRREARLLASVQHVNIGGVYGFEEHDGRRYLVLEYVEGETLEARLRRGLIPLEEALPVAIQIAEAVDAAHTQGVIHRDLKPANIMLGSSGAVKVLDFGLAKAFEDKSAPAGPDCPTVTLNPTVSGAVLGTPGYMSPEQARGDPVDARSDIWSFGCVLFEMLSGIGPFHRRTTADSIAATLHDDVPWAKLPHSAAPLGKLLRRCLARKMRRRLHSIADARIELQDLQDEPAGAPAATSRSRSAVHLSMVLPPGVSIPVFLSKPMMVTPDGASVIFAGEMSQEHRERSSSPWIAAGERHLYRRPFSEPVAHPIAGTRDGWNPFISPDGRWLGFLRGYEVAQLHRLPVDGGDPVRVIDRAMIFGADWGPDRMVYFSDLNFRSTAPTGAIARIPAQGGSIEPVTTPDPEGDDRYHYFPHVLPNGRTIIYTSYSDKSFDPDKSILWARNMETGECRKLVEGVALAQYATSGHLILARGRSLQAAPFDPDGLELGPWVTLLEDLQCSPAGGLNFAFSRSGTLAYIRGTPMFEQRRSLVWVDRHGVTELASNHVGAFHQPRLSPDGARIAVAISTRFLSWDVWVIDIERGTMSRLTFGGVDSDPVWTPDGTRIVYSSQARCAQHCDLYWIAADGSEEPELLLSTETKTFANSFSPDGRMLAFSQRGPDRGVSIWVLPVDGDRVPQPFLKRRFDQFGARFSPRGGWIAYVSNESGRNEVYARPFPGSGGRIQISAEGGTSPAWSRDGRELFFRKWDAHLAVEVGSGDGLQPSVPRLLFRGQFEEYGIMENSCNYDVAPDADRFIMVRNEEAPATRIEIVLDWFEELRALKI